MMLQKRNVTINVTDDNDVTFTATLDGEEIEFTTPFNGKGTLCCNSYRQKL